MRRRARHTTIYDVVRAAAGFVCLALLATGCAAHAKAAREKPGRGSSTRSAKKRETAPEHSAAPRPAPPRKAATLEEQDPKLSVALFALALGKTAAAHREVANEYRRLHVYDRADEHLSAAIRLRSKDATLYDARARLRRDMGTAPLALSDAYRAWYFKPTASTANTLGTVFEALGDLQAARQWYGEANKLAPQAWFALNNVCHIETMLASSSAVSACAKGLAVAPSSEVARNNMALALASAGDFNRARESFSSLSSVATAAYNMGIVYMATKQFDRAVTELQAASAADPASKQIQARLAQATRALHH